MVAGVAGGMAQYFDVDPAWIRIAWLALLVMGPGFPIYIVAWIAIPEADEPQKIAASPVKAETGSDNGRLIFGALLVLVGASLLARQYLPWMKELLLPAVLIAVGVGVIVYSLRK